MIPQDLATLSVLEASKNHTVYIRLKNDPHGLMLRYLGAGMGSELAVFTVERGNNQSSLFSGSSHGALKEIVAIHISTIGFIAVMGSQKMVDDLMRAAKVTTK